MWPRDWAWFCAPLGAGGGVAELARFYGIVIAVFFRELGQHNRPHVHAQYAEHAASIAIVDGEVLAGGLPRPALRLVREWLDLRREEAAAAWEAACEGRRPGKIRPLRGRRRK